MRKYLIIVIISLIITSMCYSVSHTLPKIKTGDIVFAEWVVNGWYHGAVGNECDNGLFMILFDDGDTKCCNIAQIVSDRVPAKEAVTVGSRVLAQWSDGRFYPGLVVNIINDTYNINFDDGDKSEVTLSQIRLRN